MGLLGDHPFPQREIRMFRNDMYVCPSEHRIIFVTFLSRLIKFSYAVTGSVITFNSLFTQKRLRSGQWTMKEL